MRADTIRSEVRVRRPKPIPGIQPPPFWRKLWFDALLAGVPPLLAAAVAAWRLSREAPGSSIAWLLWASVAWIAGATALRIASARTKDAEAEPARVHDGLRAATLLLHSSAAQLCRIPPEEAQTALRVTFHRVVPPLASPSAIEQIVPYAGGGNDGAGRRFPINVGITGLALRNKEPYLMSSAAENEAEHQQALVRFCGYTPAQARERAPGRVSALAVPVYDRSGLHPLGVIYLDSNKRQVFDDESTYQAILAACQGLGEYVSERY